MQNLVNLRHLDISGCLLLKEMPRDMIKLKNLQYLSDYLVGKQGEKGIKELGTLSNLHTSLSIAKLENVINNSEAAEAKIMDKKYLEELRLSWSEYGKNLFMNSQSEMDILGNLQPTKNLKILHALKSLVIRDCPKLEGDLPSHLPVLETIKIERCNQLKSSLPKALAIRKLYIFESNKVALHELPLSLEELRIQGIEVTKLVFEAIASTLPKSLQILDIKDCSSVISFPGDCLPTSLKFLTISNCKNLNFPMQNHQQESLKSLIIDRSCDSLSTLPLDNLPNLDDLQIFNCENIEHLSASNILSNLVCIKFRNCPKFVSLPREGLSAPNLKSLYISNCTNLKSLPCHINTLLPKLQKVDIDECPEMETFPEGGIPPSLRSLGIWNCEKLLRNPSLTLFDMISNLAIGDLLDDAIKSFPNKGFALFPPSLTSLFLWKMSSLHRLECTGLLHLTSLRKLRIEECPKLENMEGERLPASLLKLKINGCPMLEERCCMKHPQIWPKISHIKCIQVNYEWI